MPDRTARQPTTNILSESSARLRVLHVIQTIAQGDGGTSAAVLGMCRAVASFGVDPEIYATNSEASGPLKVPLFQKTSIQGVPTTFFPVQGPKQRFRLSVQFAVQLARNAGQFDLLHIHSLYNFQTLVSGHIAKYFRVPYVLQPHGALDPYHYGQRRWLKAPYEALFERRNFARATAVLFTSEEEMRLARLTGWRFNGAVTPLGTELSAVEAPDSEASADRLWPQCKGKRVVLFLGRIAEKKGFDFLIPAFANLIRDRRDLHLLIAGPENDRYGSKVRDWIREHQLDKAVTFAGMLTGEAKLSAFAVASLFVLPSRSENFGVAVIEAMAAGLPVVVSEHVNIAPQIVAADGGLVIPLGVDALRAAIATLLDHPERRVVMGHNARALVEAEFSWDRAGARLTQFYRGVLATAKADCINDNGALPVGPPGFGQ